MSKSIYSYHHIKPDILPHFGFKIHLSATIHNYKEVYSSVISFLETHEIAYKYIKNLKDIWYNFSVYETMAESGKYFTIYPLNKIQFLNLLEQLYELIPRELDGLYIMSDRPYKDSNIIFYRYGTIKWDLTYIKDGHPTLIGPEGTEWSDFQRNYFELPSWIEDIQETKLLKESYLSRNYSVCGILQSNNAGNVYRGKQLGSLKNIVIKEARPYVLYFENLEKRVLRKREFAVFQKFNKFVPKPIEYVKEWIHDFYIYEEIEGVSLYEYAKEFSIFSYSSKTNENKFANIRKFNRFLSIFKQLLELVHYFHQEGYILHDIHPDNFKIDSKNQLHIVDLEHAYKRNRLPTIGIHHEIALKEWNELGGIEADCHKVGNTMLYLLGKLHIKDRYLQEEREELVTLLMQSFGIKSNFMSVISYLFSPNATISHALELLENIEVTAMEFTYSLDISDCLDDLTQPALPSIKAVIDHFILSEDIDLSEFRECITDNHFKYFDYLMKREKKIGIEGLLGKLVYLKEEGLPSDWFVYGINYILDSLVNHDGKCYLSIGKSRLSPYLNDGNAGLIKILLHLDKNRYREIILKLADSLDFEFAQFPDYNYGMLGIADSLLDAYELFSKEKYLYFAEKLLLRASFYLKCNKISITDFYPVWYHYKEICR